jgi:peroxiredoxin
MKKLIPAFVALLSFLSSFARQKIDLMASGQVVIKGKVTNYPEQFLEIGVTSLFDPERVTLLLQPDGSFIKTIPITYTQDLIVRPGGIPEILFVTPGDTLELSWDESKSTSTFQVRACASRPWRQKELDLVMALSRSSRSASMKMYDELHKKNVPDSVKYNLVKQQFVSEVKTALATPLTINSRKIYCDIYFNLIGSLYQAKILNKYNLSFTDALSKRAADSMDLSSIHYQTIDESLFYHSSVYRDFIFDYTRFYHPFNNYLTLGHASQEPEPNYTMEDCYSGAVALRLAPKVLDWYLTKAIMFGFNGYTFEGSEAAYNQFYPIIKTPFMRDTLQHFYTSIQRLKPGNAAPGFTLKNTEGQQVSLSEFKNKIVYIDFYGVYCGPCQYEIKNHVQPLYEKYKDKDVVFLNICVDVKEKEWKEYCKKMNLHGINLLAEGWITHAVCQNYNVNGVPHFVLIDAAGKIVNNNAGRPSELLRESENEIDKLLK